MIGKADRIAQIELWIQRGFLTHDDLISLANSAYAKEQVEDQKDGD